MLQPSSGKPDLTRDPVTQSILLDMLVKNSCLFYIIQLVLPITLIILSSVIGVSFWLFVTSIFSFSVILVLVVSLIIEMEAIDSGLSGDQDRTHKLNRVSARLILWSFYLQILAVILYLVGYSKFIFFVL